MNTRPAPARPLPLGPNDAPDIALVMRQSFDATYPDFRRLHSPRDDLAFVGDTLIPQRTVLGIRTDARLVGFIAFAREDIDQLYILPGYHRRGYGTALLGAAQTTTSRLRLWTFAVNRGALRFYALHGFRQIDATDGDNEQGEPDIRLEWTAT